MRTFALLAAALLNSLLSGCAADTYTGTSVSPPPNRSEQSRQNARTAQDELSRDADKIRE